MSLQSAASRSGCAGRISCRQSCMSLLLTLPRTNKAACCFYLTLPNTNYDLGRSRLDAVTEQTAEDLSEHRPTCKVSSILFVHCDLRNGLQSTEALLGGGHYEDRSILMGSQIASVRCDRPGGRDHRGLVNFDGQMRFTAICQRRATTKDWCMQTDCASMLSMSETADAALIRAVGRRPSRRIVNPGW